MGQSTSYGTPKLDYRVADPPTLPPKGLALIAHGRLGGSIDCPIVGALATCLQKRHGCRVVTWSARGIANSQGRSEWGDLGVWVGDKSREDYSRMLHMSMETFALDFPDAKGRRLFICGYSAGAVYAGTIRPPSSPHFDRKTRYILISYPVTASPLLSLWNTGYYYRAVEALVQGWGWEGHQGDEPPAEVLTMTGGKEMQGIGVVCWTWMGILKSKDRRHNLRMEIVEGADSVWSGCHHKIGEITDNWVRCNQSMKRTSTKMWG